MELPDTTLNSALTNHFTEAIVCHLNNPRDIDSKARTDKTPHSSLPRNLAKNLLPLVGMGTNNFRSHKEEDTPHLIERVQPSDSELEGGFGTLSKCRDQVEVIRQSLKVGMLKRVHSCTTVPPSYLCPELSVSLRELNQGCIFWYVAAAFWQHIVSLAMIAGAQGTSWITHRDYRVNRHATACLINGQWVIMPHDVLLMIKDMVWGRFLIELFCIVAPEKAYCLKLIEFYWGWGFKAIKLLGGPAYNLIKSIEPLCTLRLIELSDDILDIQSQIDTMIRQLESKEVDYLESVKSLSKPWVIKDLWVFISSLKTPNEISEFFSLLKMCGHPYVDPIKGSQAIEKLAKADSTASYQGVKAVGWSFCHMFVKGYIDKHKRWPPMRFDIPDGRTSLLAKMHAQSYMPLPLGISLYDPADWDFCTFHPIDEFDYGVDILSLITDKSLSYKRSECDNSWAGRLRYSPKKPTSSNRVIEQLLKEDIDLKSVCDTVSEGTVPFDWRIVTVHPKEREMKWLIARMFAIMVIQPRLFFCLLEHNLAEKIFPFIPEQTMTMSQSEKDALFLQLSQTKPNQVTLSITLDLAKWCSHFRKFTVMMVADRLNQLLGVINLYGFVHDFFKMSIIILRHPAFTPTQDTQNARGHLNEEPGIYTGAEAGLEGIQQKLWTLVTLCMLHWAVWRFGFSYKITCQGDNLVLYITLIQKVTEEVYEFQSRVRRINTEVLQSISEAAEMIGHDVKPDECFSSTGFLTYGKEMWFKGRKLETALKVVTRMFPKTSGDAPSVESIISNIAATGTSLVERVTSPLRAFLFTKFVETLVIDRELRSSMIHSSKFSQMPELYFWTNPLYGGRLLMTLCPRNLGGFPVSTLAEFIYRGHSDPLSSSIGSLDLLSSAPIIAKFLAYLETDTFVMDLRAENDRRKSTQIVRDPYSIPLRFSRPGATLETQRVVRQTLKRITRNRFLRPIVTISADEKEEERLIANLLTTRPFYPQVAYEILKRSVFGVSTSIAKRFTNTRTLRRITSKSDSNLVSAHIFNDMEKIKSVIHFLSQVSLLGKRERSISSFKLLTLCRDKWGLGSLEGVTNYHPFVAGQIILPHLTNHDELQNLITDSNNPLMIAMSLTSSSVECHTTRGLETPFMGSTTSEKATSKYVQPIDSSPPLRDALKLIQISKLCSTPGSAFRSSVENLAKQRTSLPIELLYELASEQVGGIMAHRLDTTATTRGSRLSSLPNWSTHITVSSNLSRQMGAVDYPISYAEFYLSIIEWLKWFTPAIAIPAPFGIILLVNLDELQPLQDQMVHLESVFTPKIMTVPTDSYYLFATSVTLSAKAQLGGAMPLSLLTPRVATTVEALSVIFLSQITGRHATVRRPGYKRSEISTAIIVDQPEARILSLEEYLEAGAMAILMASSNGVIGFINNNVTFEDSALAVCLSNALILAPRIFSSISCASDNNDDRLRQTIGIPVSERNIIYLSSILAHRAVSRLGNSHAEIKPIDFPPIFEMGKSAVSTALSVRLGLIILRKLSAKSCSILVAKYLARLTRSIMERSSETERIDGLINVANATQLIDLLGSDPSAPEIVLRSTRTRTDQVPRRSPFRSYRMPAALIPELTLTDARIDLTSTDDHMSASDLIKSWDDRPHPGTSDAYYKWGPISSLLIPGESVYIVGIGAGGLLRCIPPECRVYGVDLPATLQPLGQQFVNYSCAFQHPRYETRCVSWTRNLADTKTGEADLTKDIISSNCDVVLIDVDRVAALDRIRLRQKIAELGIKCWARVFATAQLISQIEMSVAASLSTGDDWWCPSISVGREIIFGAGALVSATHIALGSAPERLFSLPVDQPTPSDKLEMVFAFGGTYRESLDIEKFINKTGLVRIDGELLSLVDAFHRVHLEPDRTLGLLGRAKCRLLVSIVRWYL